MYSDVMCVSQPWYICVYIDQIRGRESLWHMKCVCTDRTETATTTYQLSNRNAGTTNVGLPFPWGMYTNPGPEEESLDKKNRKCGVTRTYSLLSLKVSGATGATSLSQMLGRQACKS